MDAPLLLRHDPQLGELLVALVDLRQERSRGHAHDRVVGHLPVELLLDLEAHALAALGVVGAHIDVHEGPAVFAGDLRAEAVDLVVVALDAHHVRAVHERVEHLALLQVGGNEDVGVEAGGGGIGGHRVGKIASGGAGHRLEAQFHGAAQSHAHHAVLERQRGVVDRVVLDPELADAEALGEAVGLHQRRIAHLAADRRLAGDRQQLAIAPHGLGTREDGLPVQRAPDALVVIGDFEGTEIELTDVRGGQRIFATTLSALQRLHETVLLAHDPSLPRLRRACSHNDDEKRAKTRTGSSHRCRNPVAGTPNRNWHLDIELPVRPVAVASSGRTLRHSG